MSTMSAVLYPASTAAVTITDIYVTPDVVNAATVISLVEQVVLTALSILSLAQSTTDSILDLMAPGVTSLRDPSTYRLVRTRRYIQRANFLMGDNNNNSQNNNYVPSRYYLKLPSLVRILWDLEGSCLTYDDLRDIQCERE